MSTLSKTARQAIEAYGGIERWRSAHALEGTVSAHGLLFSMKMRKGSNYMRVKMELWNPRVRLSPVDKAGNVGVLDGDDSVRVEDPKGTVLEKRAQPRQKFPYGRRLFWWDRLDSVYFDAYALWNYFTLPAQLLRDDIQWIEMAEGVLEAHYPRSFPTHSPTQKFYFDSAGLLRRNDYTTDVLGGWAMATWMILEHGYSDGIAYVSRKKATPRPGGRLLSFPVMAELRVHEWRLL